MPKTYSLDLRQKVIKYIKEGNSLLMAATIFDVGKSTIYRWLDLEKTGDISPKKGNMLRVLWM